MHTSRWPRKYAPAHNTRTRKYTVLAFYAYNILVVYILHKLNSPLYVQRLLSPKPAAAGSKPHNVTHSTRPICSEAYLF